MSVVSVVIAAATSLDDRQLLFITVVAVIVFLATSTRGAPRRCRRCRELNRPQAVFCAQCGVRLRSR
ncbi:MAG: hypothetical protein HY763_03730 [Planctomycetes bacterium]|nr:hypothetical protein [Planctomycetota bacterium]